MRLIYTAGLIMLCVTGNCLCQSKQSIQKCIENQFRYISIPFSETFERYDVSDRQKVFEDKVKDIPPLEKRKQEFVDCLEPFSQNDFLNNRYDILEFIVRKMLYFQRAMQETMVSIALREWIKYQAPVGAMVIEGLAKKFNSVSPLFPGDDKMRQTLRDIVFFLIGVNLNRMGLNDVDEIRPIVEVAWTNIVKHIDSSVWQKKLFRTWVSELTKNVNVIMWVGPFMRPIVHTFSSKQIQEQYWSLDIFLGFDEIPGVDRQYAYGKKYWDLKYQAITTYLRDVYDIARIILEKNPDLISTPNNFPTPLHSLMAMIEVLDENGFMQNPEIRSGVNDLIELLYQFGGLDLFTQARPMEPDPKEKKEKVVPIERSSYVYAFYIQKALHTLSDALHMIHVRV